MASRSWTGQESSPGSGIVAQDASYPGLIVMATRPIPYTRLFEQALARQVALQWSACATGAEELSDPGIAQGLASYSEMRYLDEKYGRTSLLSNRLLSWALKGLNSEYYHKLYYYLGASNRVLCTDPAECRDQVGYVAAEQARPALLLRAEERRTGQAAFDSLMRNWIDSQAGAHPVRSDFAAHFPTVHAQLTGAVSADDILPTRLQSRRVQVRPIFALPSFTDYQIFYGPWIWADYYHGLELGIGIQGRQFLDGGPLRGRHQWSASEVYSFAIRDTHSSFSYQTPLTFINDRLRAYVALDYSTIDNGAKLFFTQELGPVFRQPKTTIDFGYRILNIKKLDLRDTVAWELARTADVRLRMAQTYESRLLLGGVQAYVRGGDRALGSNYSYVRAGLEQSHTYRGLRPVDLSIRLFGGYIWGDVPRQDEFYLSGGLTSNSSEPVKAGPTKTGRPARPTGTTTRMPTFAAMPDSIRSTLPAGTNTAAPPTASTLKQLSPSSAFSPSIPSSTSVTSKKRACPQMSSCARAWTPASGSNSDRSTPTSPSGATGP